MNRTLIDVGDAVPGSDMEQPLAGWPYQWHLRIFVLAVVARGVYFFQYLQTPLNGELRVDHAYYFEWAKQIFAGDWLGREVFEMSPLYPYLLAGMMHLTGVKLNWLIVTQLLAGAASCVLVYSCASRLFDKRTAILGGVVAAAYGPQIFYECMIMKEFLSPIFTIIATYAALRYAEGPHRIRWLCMIGFAIGLACLIRENHILMLVPIGLWIVTSAGTRTLSVRARLLHFVAVVSLTLSCLIPTAVRNYAVSGTFVAVTTGGGEVFYMAHGPYAQPYYQWPPFVTPDPFREHEDFRREAARRTGRTMTRKESSAYWFRQGVDEMLAHPARAVSLTAQKALVLFNDYEVPDSESFAVSRLFIPLLRYLPTFGWIGALGFLGTVCCLPNLRKYQLIVGVAAAHAISVLVLYNFGRFRIGMMPAWIMLASFACTWFFRTCHRGGLLPWIRLSGAILTVGLLSVNILAEPLGRIPVGHQINDATRAYGLALQAGLLPTAESELRKAIRLSDEIDPKAEFNSDQVAWFHLQLARLLSRNGPHSDATAQFRSAIELAKESSVKEKALAAWTRYLIRMLHSEESVANITNPRSELVKALSDLRKIAPGNLSHWAVSALFCESANNRREIADGLESAWKLSDQASTMEEGWHFLGLAALAKQSHAASKTPEYAGQALLIWPEHPFRKELEQMLQGESPKPGR